MFRYLTLIFFILIKIDTYCQPDLYINKQINLESGLSSLKIISICQDKDGFIWFGTIDGLNRYDGKVVTIFRNIQGDSTSLSNNFVTTIIKDIEGTLWIATYKGLNKYIPQSNSFKSYITDSTNKFSLQNDFVRTIIDDKHGNLWLGTWNGISKFNIHEEKFYPYQIDSENYKDTSFFKTVIMSMCIDKNNIIWAGTWTNGVYCFDTKIQKFTNHFLFNAKGEEYKIYSIVENKNKINIGLWGGGIALIDETTNQINILYPGKKQDELDNNNKILSLIYNDSSELIAGTEGGLFFFDKNNKIKYSITEKDKNVKLTDRIATTFFKDINEDLWIGTLTGGVNFLTKKNFYKFQDDNVKFRYINNIIKLSETKIAFSYSEGINSFDLKSRIIEKLPVSEKVQSFIDKSGVGMYLKGNTGIDWIRSSNLFAVKNNKIIFELNVPEIKEIAWLDEDDQSNLWLATQTGLYSINSQTYNLTQYIDKRDLKQFQKYNELFWVFIDSNNKIWAGSNIGLKQLKIIGNKYEFIYYNVNAEINQIYESCDSLFWLATKNGIVKFNPLNGKYTNIRVSEDIIKNTINTIIADDEKNLWLGTNNGLFRYDFRNNSFQYYNTLDGLSGNVFIHRSALKLNNGILAFISEGGLTWVDPKKIQFENKIFNVKLTDIKILNKSIFNKDNYSKYFKGSTENDNQLHLDYNNSLISISFVSPQYKGADKTIYYYHILPTDTAWINMADNKNLNITHLNPGTYQLFVKAYNNSGWSPQSRILTIIVSPPFWLTWWFRICIVIILTISIISIYKIRVKALEHQKKVLEKTVVKRTTQLQEANILLSEQKAELASQAENLTEINVLLVERQEELEAATEELQMQSEELLKLNATKDKFFSIISHDLRNPFQGVLSFTELLIDNFHKIDEKKKIEYLNIIKASSNGAFSLLENLLVWSRTQSKQIALNPVAIKLFEIVNETIELLSLNAKNKGIILNNKTDAEIIVYADKNMITTVIRNLVNNAIKFSKQGDTVSIFANELETAIEIIVSDTGIGMSAEAISRLFRIDQNHSTQGTSGESGTGLGLIICKEFIEKNNGYIKVESTLDVGTSFIIHLPKDINQPITELIQKKESENNILSQNEDDFNENDFELYIEADIIKDDERFTVLIVEDNPNIRLSIKQGISDRYEILEAVNGKEGLTIALETIPDIIISDVMMPEMNGFQLCEKLKTDVLTCHIPIILLTARNTDNSKIKGLETGADDYITKPFNLQVLRIRIRKLIESRKKLREIFSKELRIEPSAISVNSVDEKFVQHILKIIEENMSDPNFGVDQFVDKVGMGRTLFYKKVKSLTNQSVNDLLKTMRLKRAAQLLIVNQKTISEICFEIGYTTPSYFSTLFKNEFGLSPTEYIEKNKKL